MADTRIALMKLVVRCLGCGRLRVKYPDGHDAMCPWCHSNSSVFLDAEAGLTDGR